jgi:hypothetical protein
MYSHGQIEVERDPEYPMAPGVMHINTSNIRRFTVVDPFLVESVYVDGQEISCQEKLCWSFIKESETGQWKVKHQSIETNHRMNILGSGVPKAHPLYGALPNDMDGNWVRLLQ